MGLNRFPGSQGLSLDCAYLHTCSSSVLIKTLSQGAAGAASLSADCLTSPVVIRPTPVFHSEFDFSSTYLSFLFYSVPLLSSTVLALDSHAKDLAFTFGFLTTFCFTYLPACPAADSEPQHHSQHSPPSLWTPTWI